jgi:hypothetical protein
VTFIGDHLAVQAVSLRTKSGGARRRAQNRAPNEGKFSPLRNDKPLKSLGAKSRDFAESFVIKGLIGFSFRRFHESLDAGAMHARLP